ncbi:MAG: hypothetical protein GKS05_11255 [Nitrospirales bacterium]|nr:hypothetical protein [Nitrospirales bacterium]
MNQRRHLLGLARKGDEKAINQLLELYQVRVYSGETFQSTRQSTRTPKSSPKAKTTVKTTKVKQEKAVKSPAKRAKQWQEAPHASSRTTKRSQPASRATVPKKKSR